MAPLVVVFGGGSVGNAVARVAIEQGKRVRIATRSGRGELPKGADAVKADAGDASSVKSACDGAASVIFCAAPPYTDWPAQYPKMQAGVLEGAAAAGRGGGGCTLEFLSPTRATLHGSVVVFTSAVVTSFQDGGGRLGRLDSWGAWG